MENLILIDWLSVTRPRSDTITKNDEDTGKFFIDALGMSQYDWQVSDGVKGFSTRLWFDGINIHLPSQKMPYVWLEMSGSGCRAFETYGSRSWIELLDYMISSGCNIKRLDLAYDDHSGVLQMPVLVEDTLNEMYVSKANKHEVIIGMDDVTHARDCSIYHGSKSSNTLIRIYDKAKQLDLGKEHWIRAELQLRDENAHNTAALISTGVPVGDLYCGILARYVRYVDDNPNDYNKWRWPVKQYWSDFLLDAQPIKIASAPGVEYNISNLENYVFNMAGNAIKTYIDAFGIDVFLKKVKEYKPYITNPKYRKLLEEIQNA